MAAYLHDALRPRAVVIEPLADVDARIAALAALDRG